MCKGTYPLRLRMMTPLIDPPLSKVESFWIIISNDTPQTIFTQIINLAPDMPAEGKGLLYSP